MRRQVTYSRAHREMKATKAAVRVDWDLLLATWVSKGLGFRRSMRY